MPRYRYWLLDDEEDENDPWIKADDPEEAAELAAYEFINDGSAATSYTIAVRDVDGGSAEMYEIYVDWSPTCTAHHRGQLPEQEDGKPDQA